MLTYAQVHYIYTLPVVVVLALVCRPFTDRSELFKIAVLSTIALVYTTPWDNYIVYHGAWTYPIDRVITTIGHVPLEEYVFMVLQTILTTLWALLCVRWSMPCTNFNHDKRTYRQIQGVPIALLAVIGTAGYVMAIPGHNTFYLGALLWWATPVIAFLWYGAGNFFVKKLHSSLIAVIVPTFYLSWVDAVCLRQNVWHINEATSLNLFVIKDLPLEEVTFFFTSNLIIVLGVLAYDKSRGMMETYTTKFPRRFGVNWEFIRQTFKAFATLEYSISSTVTGDVKECIDVINAASKSFSTASSLFQSGIRLDLTILYAFCRVTDDMIDEESDIGKKKLKLKVTKRFIDELFVGRKSDSDVEIKPRLPNIDWRRYQYELTETEIACFRAFSRISFYMPRKPIDELLKGYQWDMEGRLIKNEYDLLSYSDLVAGTVGEMCVHVMMYRCCDTSSNFADKDKTVLKKAHQMGKVLQLVNIARDIVTDSEKLGRCYVPINYMDDENEEIQILCKKRSPWDLGNKKLKKYSSTIIDLANKQFEESIGGIKYLPRETRGAVVAAIEIYRGISVAIQSKSTYQTRTSLSKWKKICIGFYCFFIKRT